MFYILNFTFRNSSSLTYVLVENIESLEKPANCSNWGTVVDLLTQTEPAPAHPQLQGRTQPQQVLQSYKEQYCLIDFKVESGVDRKKSFENIYRDKWWLRGSGESASGHGSNTKNTRDMLHILHSVTDHLKIILNQKRISILDSSCGDMYWMPEFLNNRSDVDFTGYDITDSNIDNHKKNFREFTRQK